MTRVHHTAAEHDSLDIQQIDNTCDASADVFTGALDHHQRKIVTFICLMRDVVGGEDLFQSKSRKRRG